MNLLISTAGIIGVALFAAAGFRMMNHLRYRSDRRNITYHGRIQEFYEGMRQSAQMSVATFLKRASFACSRHAPSTSIPSK